MIALDELIDANEPGRELVEERQSELLGLQVAARSPMGAFAYERRHHDRRQLAARA